MRLAPLTLLIAGLTLLAGPAPAQTKAPAAEKRQTPLTRLNAKTDAMMKGLSEAQTKEFATIRAAHGTLRAVEDIRGTLDRAVTSCAKANPDMKEDLTGRFQSWKNNVLPVLRQGHNRVEKMILTQSVTSPGEIRSYLKLLDAAIADQNSQFKEVPVSKKDACETMAENMSDTQKEMVELMTQTLGLDEEPPIRK